MHRWNQACYSREASQPLWTLKIPFSYSTKFFLPRECWATAVLVIAGGAIYGQTVWHPFISFDDPGYVYRNTHVTAGLTIAGWDWAWTSLEESNWHPLTWLSLMLDAQVYGPWAGGFHLTNLLLHLANATLLFRFLRVATGAWWPSVLTAFFFVAHPLHVESVAWVTERKDVLSTFFFCLLLLAYGRYARGGGTWSYVGAVGSFALGLAAKPMLVTVPGLLLLLDFWPFRREENASWGRLLWEKLPFALLSLASCWITVLAQRAEAMVPLDRLPATQRLAAAVLGYGTYLWKTFVPTGLGVYYPYWQAQALVKPLAWAAVLAGITLLAAWSARRRPFLWVGWAWFLGTLVPVIGVVQVGGQATADRYTYLPHIGLFIAVCWTGAEAWQRWQGARLPLGLIAAGMGAACVGSSIRQAGYWRSSVTLFERTVAVTRPSGRLCQLFGDALLESGQPERATALYLQSWELGGLNNEASALLLGALLLKASRWHEAVAVLLPWSERPGASADLLSSLGAALVNDQRVAEAQEVYERCVRRFPSFAPGHFGLAAVLQTRGLVGEAAAHDEAGLNLQPDHAPALTRLAWNYTHSGDLSAHDSAEVLAQHAVALTAGRDLNSLNVLAFTQGVRARWEEAVHTAEKAVALAEGEDARSEEAAKCRERLARYRQRQLP